MLNISCLHPARADIAVFEAARRALKLDDVMLRHRVRSDLAIAADSRERLSPATIRHTAAELLSLAKGADGLLVTTAALGSLNRAAGMLGVPVVEVRTALAEAAVAQGGTVVALCVAGSALAPTRALFDSAAIATNASVEVRLLPGAADLDAADRAEDFRRALADAVDLAFAEGASTVALTATVMAAAAPSGPGRIVTAPAAGLAAIVAAVQARPLKAPEE